LLRDRDGIYREKSVNGEMDGIPEVLAAPRSSWQNAYAERLTGSIRRGCLEHVIVFHETGLRWVLKDCFNTAKGAARICHSKKMRPSADLSSLPRSVM
jgi:hypothetical protein